MNVLWSFSRNGSEMEVDTVNISGADAWKGRRWGGGTEQSEGSCLQAEKDSPWTLEVGVDPRPHPDLCSHSGLQGSTLAELGCLGAAGAIQCPPQSAFPRPSHPDGRGAQDTLPLP